MPRKKIVAPVVDSAENSSEVNDTLGSIENATEATMTDGNELNEEVNATAMEPQPSEEAEAAAEAEADADAEETVPEEAPKKPAKRSRKKSEQPDPDLAKTLNDKRHVNNMERTIRAQDRADRLEENQQFYAGISALQEAQRRGRIMSGRVVAVERIDDKVMLLVLADSRYRVMIPFTEFYRDNPIDMSTVDTGSREGRDMLARRQRQMCEKMYNAEVEFIIKHIEFESSDNYAIVASRKDALEIQEMRNFIGLKNRRPLIEEGDVHTAKILAVGPYMLYVNLGGVDVQVPLRDVTYRYTTNLEQKYQAGDTINMVVRSINTRKQDSRVELELDAKSAELLAARRKQSLGVIRIGTTTLGTITSIRQSRKRPNKIIIHAHLPFFDMPCVIGSLDPTALAIQPKAGDGIRLEVVGFHESGFVLARCCGFHNIANKLLH